MREIARELADIAARRPPTADELALIQRTRTLSLPGRWETSAAILDAVDELVRFRLPDDYWNGFADRVNGLTIADVTHAAAEFITPDDIVWVVIGDLEKIGPGLRDLGFDEIRLLDADGRPAAGD